MIPTDILIWQQRLAIIRNHLDDDWQRTSALLYKVQTEQPFDQDDLDYINQLTQWYQGRESKHQSANGLWSFKCLNCGFIYQVTEPDTMYNFFKRKTCPQCHSKNIEKVRTKRGLP